METPRRRRLPMVRFGSDYTFATTAGPRTLLELFGEHEQLAVYQFMNLGPSEFCPGCTKVTDNVPATALPRLAEGESPGQVLRAYSTTRRGVDRLVVEHNILDLAPYGRQEDWEDSPPGWPQYPTYG